MGLPKILSDPKTVFPRTFRFLFTPNNHPDFQYLVQKVSVDYTQKSLDAFILELDDCRTQEWLLDMAESGKADDFTLVAVDGCGYHLYVLEFFNVKVVWHSVDYDYAKSDIVTHHVGFEYERMKTSVKKRPQEYSHEA